MSKFIRTFVTLTQYNTVFMSKIQTTVLHTMQTITVPDINEHEVQVLDDYSPPFHQQEFTSDCMNILIIRDGICHAFYDKKEVLLRKNDVLVILPNHICQELSTGSDYHVSIIAMSPKFLEEVLHSTIHRHFIRYHYAPLCSLTDDQCASILRLTETIREVSALKQIPYRHDILIHLVDVLLSLLSYYRSETEDKREDISSHSYEIYNRFCDLLVKHYHESREVAFYADKLQLTPKHFSKVVLDATGHTALFWIEQHIIIKAKQMLRSRLDLSIQEICYDLGFSELSNFSRYFKRATGYSPKAFRDNPALK